MPNYIFLILWWKVIHILFHLWTTYYWGFYQVWYHWTAPKTMIHTLGFLLCKSEQMFSKLSKKTWVLLVWNLYGLAIESDFIPYRARLCTTFHGHCIWNMSWVTRNGTISRGSFITERFACLQATYLSLLKAYFMVVEKSVTLAHETRSKVATPMVLTHALNYFLYSVHRPKSSMKSIVKNLFLDSFVIWPKDLFHLVDK